MTAPYVLNLKAKVVHRNPSQERCNMDDAQQRGMADEEGYLKLIVQGWRCCKLCFALRMETTNE